MATLPNPLPRLATDPSGRSLGLQLPPGRLVDETDDGPWHEPLLWLADKPAAPGAWKVLGAPARRVGLLPVLVDVGGAMSGPERWELGPGLVSYPGDHDAEEILAEYWAEEMEEGGGEFGGDWTGLAPRASLVADPDTRAAQVADALAGGTRPWPREPRLALVPARRSADIPAAIGWTGPLNYEGDVGRTCAVLRSWEDRFGIRVTALDYDTLAVSVAAPPATPAQAEAVAAEHFAFCSAAFTESLEAYARELVGATVWSFRWD
ncbi:DUF4253 domain-containing protein [Streptomyces tricolor]|uniref:DUF4253 domain-containing protein n=1 Tax=Streptomyces tricolor TaxID=68277 RepID=UPI00380F9569